MIIFGIFLLFIFEPTEFFESLPTKSLPTKKIKLPFPFFLFTQPTELEIFSPKYKKNAQIYVNRWNRIVYYEYFKNIYNNFDWILYGSGRNAFCALQFRLGVLFNWNGCVLVFSI